MKLLKELFSSREYDSNDDYGMGEDEQEFDFDFDFENPDADGELDFDHRQYSDEEGMEDEEFEDGYGAEEDYPEGMMDMPHDDFEEDGEGGLVSDDGMEDEIEDIKGEIESLYARLGKLAAAGDLDLMDGDPEEFEMEMGDEPPDFSSFRDMDLSDEMGPEDEMAFDGEETDLPLDRPEFR